MSMALIIKGDNREAKLNLLVALNMAAFFLISRIQLVPNSLADRALASNSCYGLNRIVVSKIP